MNARYLPVGLAVLALGVQAVAAQTLRSLAEERGRYVGSILNSEWFNNQTPANYEATHKAQFNAVVAENEMKFDALEPSQNNFSWTKGDKLVAYAKANGMRVRGHALAWHSQVPGWVSNGSWTRQTLLAVLKNHITKVVTHYKGDVDEWDVVNEAITDANTKDWRGLNGDNSSVWGKIIGADFIDSAFVWAHAADPDAKLFYNDYGIEWGTGTGSKAGFLLAAVDKWKQNGIPIHAVGTQTHVANTHTGTPANVRALAKALAQRGVELAITELDIGFASGYTPNSSDLAAQGHLYAQFMDVFLEEPNMKSFIVWGHTDAYSWLSSQGKGYGLLYDSQINKKPAYDSLIASLQRHSVTTPVSSSGGGISSSSAVPVPQTPYSGAIAIPGRLQAENYDLGGEGVAYSDSDPDNQGATYRQDGVDLGGDATSQEYVVGWTAAGEWLEYTIHVAVSGILSFAASVTSNADGAQFHLEIDGADVTGAVSVPNTGGWSAYTTVTGNTTAVVPAGQHILRLSFDASSFNVDWIEFTSGTTSVRTAGSAWLAGPVTYTVYALTGNVVKQFQTDGALGLQAAWDYQRAGFPVGKYLVKMDAPGMKSRVVPMLNR